MHSFHYISYAVANCNNSQLNYVVPLRVRFHFHRIICDKFNQFNWLFATSMNMYVCIYKLRKNVTHSLILSANNNKNRIVDTPKDHPRFDTQRDARAIKQFSNHVLPKYVLLNMEGRGFKWMVDGRTTTTMPSATTNKTVLRITRRCTTPAEINSINICTPFCHPLITNPLCCGTRDLHTLQGVFIPFRNHWYVTLNYMIIYLAARKELNEL